MKYILTDEKREYSNRTLYRIKALKDFAFVKKGELGGWVEKEENLSQLGGAWVSDNAQVCDNAQISGSALIFGDADICGNAQICGKNDYIVFKNNWSSGRYFTWTRSNNMWKIGFFYGTGEELVEKAYKDNRMNGRKYEAYVNFVHDLQKIDQE